MKALVGLVVAVAVLVLGALPALALVLQDDTSDTPGHRSWMMRGTDPDGVVPGRPFGGELPPRVERCFRGAPDPMGPTDGDGDGDGHHHGQPGDQPGMRPGAPDDSRPGDISRWRDKSLRSFAHCLRLLRGGPTAPGSPS